MCHVHDAVFIPSTHTQAKCKFKHLTPDQSQEVTVGSGRRPVVKLLTSNGSQDGKVCPLRASGFKHLIPDRSQDVTVGSGRKPVVRLLISD